MFTLIEASIFELKYDTASDSNLMSAGNEDYSYNNPEVMNEMKDTISDVDGVRPSATTNSIGYRHQTLYGKG